MKMNHWPGHDPIKNYFSLPNEIFSLNLCPGEIVVYSYLLFCEDRKTYQCWPSYKTIGRAVGMGETTVRKYVGQLERADEEHQNRRTAALMEKLNLSPAEESPCAACEPLCAAFEGKAGETHPQGSVQTK